MLSIDVTLCLAVADKRPKIIHTTYPYQSHHIQLPPSTPRSKRNLDLVSIRWHFPTPTPHPTVVPQACVPTQRCSHVHNVLQLPVPATPRMPFSLPPFACPRPSHAWPAASGVLGSIRDPEMHCRRLMLGLVTSGVRMPMCPRCSSARVSRHLVQT